jgi:hypothetical protein
VVDVALPADPADLVAQEPHADEVLRIEVLEVERHVPSRVRVTVVDAEAPPDRTAVSTEVGTAAASENRATSQTDQTEETR